MKHVLAALLLTGIAACSSLGLTPPKGFDQSLAEAYGVHTAVLNATTTALNSGSINSSEASEVATQATSARSLLDLAKAAETAGNAAGAQRDLALASTALNALNSYLQGKH